MTTEASPVTSVARPPANDAAFPGGASVRASARVRPVVPVRRIESQSGLTPDDPYVRRFWVA
ncbi:MAG: hypothetical protein OEM39_06075, partial [Acidimicrobiia bacterium]|nr:hypothetical protein [Acidimicrobiia bacterium]